MMENNLFVATMLGCGTNDLDVFFGRLDKYEDTVFFHDEEFSYEKLIEETKFRAGNDYGLNDLMETLDYMAVDSALGQVTQSEKFDEFKQQLIKEFNDLHIEGMPKVTELSALIGGYVNLEYTLPNGQKVKYLDDGAPISAISLKMNLAVTDASDLWRIWISFSYVLMKKTARILSL